MLRHVIIKPIEDDSVAYPTSANLILTTAAGEKIYEMTAPNGYTCLGNIMLKKGEELDDVISGYCCPKNNYLVEAAEQKLRYMDGKNPFPSFTGWIYGNIRKNPDGVISSTFSVRKTNVGGKRHDSEFTFIERSTIILSLYFFSLINVLVKSQESS